MNLSAFPKEFEKKDKTIYAFELSQNGRTWKYYPDPYNLN